MTDLNTIRPAPELLEGISTRSADENREDYLDYCAASAALDEAIADGEVTPLEEFAKELGITL